MLKSELTALLANTVLRGALRGKVEEADIRNRNVTRNYLASPRINRYRMVVLGMDQMLRKEPAAEESEMCPLLEGMVEHSDFVGAEENLDNAYETLKKKKREFLAVLKESKFVGIISRSQIGLLLSGRYGYAIYGRQKVEEHLIQPLLSISSDLPILEVFNRVLSRQGERFFDDVSLLDIHDCYLGMIPVERLVRLQSDMIHQKIDAAEKSRQELQSANIQLYRSINELRQSKGKYDILFENSAMGVALLNPRGEVETMNRRMESLLRSDAEENLARLNLCARVAPQERMRFLELLQEHELNHQSKDSRSVEFNLNLPRLGNRLFKFHSTWIPETGQVCALIDDITEQRVLEKRMAQKERSELLESIVGGIAHEINNKLTPVVGFATLLNEQVKRLKNSEDISQYCLVIQNSALESAKIIRQLLQLSRPHNLELGTHDLREIATDAAKFLKFKMGDADVQMTVDFPDFPTLVLADANQIKQVVMNLIINAVDAMDQSKVRNLNLKIVRSEEQTFFSVTDSGHGISPEHLSRIFDPFFTTKPTDRGTGLGLSVCHSIIQQHCGEITVQTEVNKGTTFTVTLPNSNEEKLGDLDSDPMLVSASPPSNHEEINRAKVLIVDDDPYMTSLLQEALRIKVKCRVEVATDGHEAIKFLKESLFDLVISDVRMPGLDGFGLYDWINENLPSLRNRFLFITGDAGSADLDQKLSSLGVPVLRKPFNLAEFI